MDFYYLLVSFLLGVCSHDVSSFLLLVLLLLLHTILVPSVAVGLEFSPREAVPSKGNDDDVQKEIGGHFLVAFPYLLGDFPAAVPFLDELVFGNLVPCGDGSTGHAAAGHSGWSIPYHNGRVIVRGNKGSSSVPEFQIIESDSRIFKNEGQKISDKRRRTNKPKIKHNNWSRTHPFLSPIHEINNEETKK